VIDYLTVHPPARTTPVNANYTLASRMAFDNLGRPGKMPDTGQARLKLPMYIAPGSYQIVASNLTFTVTTNNRSLTYDAATKRLTMAPGTGLLEEIAYIDPQTITGVATLSILPLGDNGSLMVSQHMLDDFADIPFTCYRGMTSHRTNEPQLLCEKTLPGGIGDLTAAKRGRGNHVMFGADIEFEMSLVKNLPNSWIWYNLPHYADQTFAYAVARVVVTELPVGRKAIVGWSNENWNGQFTVTGDTIDYAIANDIPFDPAVTGNVNAENHSRRMRVQALRSKLLLQIFKDVFSAAGRADDLIIVCEGQSGDGVDNMRERMGYGGFHTICNAWAAAPYYGGGVGGDVHNVGIYENFTPADRRLLIENPSAFKTLVFQRLAESIPAARSQCTWISSQLRLFEAEKGLPANSIDFFFYEFGEHLQFASYSFGQWPEPYRTALIPISQEIQTDSRWAAMNQMYLTSMSEVGGVQCLFEYSTPLNNPGTYQTSHFGHMTRPGDRTNPNWTGVKNFASRSSSYAPAARS
jgi:hypothetical protein